MFPEDAIVLVATKATDLEKLVAPLAAALHPGQAVGLLQNGLGGHKFVRKALLNLAVSGVCSIVGERNGVIMESPELRAIVDDLLAEAWPIAAAEGVVMGAEDVERLFTAIANTRDNWNAMLQDLRRGSATEMPYLNTAVDRLARRHGLTAPVNATVARLVGHLARDRARTAFPG